MNLKQFLHWIIIMGEGEVANGDGNLLRLYNPAIHPFIPQTLMEPCSAWGPSSVTWDSKAMVPTLKNLLLCS